MKVNRVSHVMASVVWMTLLIVLASLVVTGARADVGTGSTRPAVVAGPPACC
jgi:hypothetical protein